MATISNFVRYETTDSEADKIAAEHIAWAKKAGLWPCHVLRSIGCKTDYGARADWKLVREKLRLFHICHVQPLLNTRNSREDAA